MQSNQTKQTTPLPRYSFHTGRAGFGDRVLMYLMAATVAKIRGVSVLTCFEEGTHADMYGENNPDAKKRKIAFNISAVSYPGVLQHVTFPPELVFVSCGTLVSMRMRLRPLLPSLGFPHLVRKHGPQSRLPTNVSQFAERASELFGLRDQGLAEAALNSGHLFYLVPETAQRWFEIMDDPVTAPYDSFLAAYQESCSQLRLTSPMMSARLPKPPYVAVHARRGERARKECRAHESKASCDEVRDDVRKADAKLLRYIRQMIDSGRKASQRWLIASDDADYVSVLGKAILAASSTIVFPEPGPPEEPKGLTDVLDFFALSRATTIVQSIPQPMGPVPNQQYLGHGYAGWSSYSYAASRLGSGHLKAIVRERTRLYAMEALAGRALSNVTKVAL